MIFVDHHGIREDSRRSRTCFITGTVSIRNCAQTRLIGDAKENIPSAVILKASFSMGRVEWVHGHKQAARDAWQVLERYYPQHPRTAMAKLYLQSEKP